MKKSKKIVKLPVKDLEIVEEKNYAYNADECLKAKEVLDNALKSESSAIFIAHKTEKGWQVLLTGHNIYRQELIERFNHAVGQIHQ